MHTLHTLARLRPQMQNVVLVGGVFDILHSGHIDHLREAKSLGNTLVVHVASDKRVRIKKGPQRPVMGQVERAKIVSAIRYVDYVFIADLPHYDQKVLQAIQPDVLLLNHEAVTEPIRDYLRDIDPAIRIVISEAPKVSSTTAIIAKSQMKQLS